MKEPVADPAPPAELAARLQQFPLLSGLPAEAVRKLAAAAHVRRFAAGETLFRQGDPARAFYAVLAGGVRVVRLLPDGRDRVLHRLRAGQTFAEAAVLSMPTFPATAIATAGGAEVAEVPAREFIALVENEPGTAKAMIASLAGWLVHLVGRVEELTALSADARLARWLLDAPSHSVAGGFEVTLSLAKKDLAAHLGITPETLSRVLRRWTDQGIVRSKGPSVTILAAEDLVSIADGSLPPS